MGSMLPYIAAPWILWDLRKPGRVIEKSIPTGEKPSPAIASCVRLAVAAASVALPEGLGKPLSLSGWWCNDPS